jgi:ATP-binding cassette subfamily B multidrug efflux pump
MKELFYLNKYLLKYKKLMILGLIWVIISNAFQILPAQMVRYSIDLVTDNIRIYRSLDKSVAQPAFFNVFSKGILIYALLILGMALLRGFFLYLVRQTLIVAP